MGIQLIDGKGTGGAAEVENQKLVTIDEGLTSFARAALRGDAYVWHTVAYSATAADTIQAVRNTSSSRNLHIEKLVLSTNASGVAQVHVVPNSAALAGTGITGVNLNFTSGNVAPADAQTDETTNSSQGTRITSVELPADSVITVEYNGALILDTNDTVAVDYVETTSAPEVSIFGYFVDK